MFSTLILIVHVIVCVAMILIILLQTGKGADIGAAFGGGSSQTVFGSSGAATFLSKVTIVAAVVFMTTSFVLTYVSGRQAGQIQRSVVTETPVPQAPLPGPETGAGGPEGPGAIPAATPQAGASTEAKPDVQAPDKTGQPAEGGSRPETK
ncbi:MAG: preprotein translocase subunit SecG [Desulfomonilaceae bacterium]|nr:preprotein translocase subunit SecG [Desulfomonilaceae bacterium]